MKGSIAALDVGARRIGVARCDPTRTVVTPVTVLERASPERDKRRLEEIIDREEPVMLVVGLPLLMSGEEGEQAQKVRREAGMLLEGRREPVVFWDERLTTFEADRRGARAGGDAVAAAIILEDYLRESGDSQ